MIPYLQQKRVPTRDTNSIPPKKRWRIPIAQWGNHHFDDRCVHHSTSTSCSG
ncbi:hypothetical protein [Candidatus Parabeggiatoa sp. HSG14]|uniref:hypothetical protein n=1 Tax=Candidatus Parabeggiatoa sp. HSG14 TaxID=3055593 RepID=UPI0025A7D7E4|nr:hypothetical protein [Thiotrichales bacterium HSG14]